MPANDGGVLVWTAISAVGALVGFYIGFQSLRKARLIEDVPTARIRSAHQGHVELIGTAVPLEGPAIAPLTGSPCCWYRYSVEKKQGKNYRRVEGATSERPFVLEDETGRCVINPQGAEVIPTDRSIWFGASREPDNRAPRRPRYGSFADLFRIHRYGLLPATYRYTEERIYPDDPLYALGLFKTLDEVDHQARRRDIALEIMREWKQDQTWLLRTFDRNADGRIDDKEWEAARRVAEQQARRRYDLELEGRIPHSLSRTHMPGQPFLISALPQGELIRRYRRGAAIGLIAFFGLGSLCAYLVKALLGV